ncbi:LysR family transcriptional regulator [Sedimentitalea sp. JM2-8]|uniref:LysR family transcriptional regulator n=1 Tax=Sedimentitalea xiamensis TaxID=3050037 RepID=A0ABT7FFQ6_9RHOB|nr:LysR family transcriptional regulator [Sedimentitalea xiamensis]MDK3073902.1 LysR family transcriptional regulator [Sedimentitalea xiamensis]
MELRQLRYFLAVASQGSISQAARVLHIAQPALSRQIRQLEQELRLTAFERTGSGTRLTEDGKRLQVLAESVMQRIALIEEEFSGRGHEDNRLSVGLPPAIGKLLLGRTESSLAALRRTALLQFSEAPSHRLEAWLRAGDIDCAVLTNPSAESMLTTSPLWEESLFVIGAPGEFAASRIPISMLDGRTFVLTTEQDWVRRYLEAEFERHGVRTITQMEVESHFACINACAGGGLNSILPFSAFSSELSSGVISAAQVEGLTISRVWARRRLLPESEPMVRLHGILRDKVAPRYMNEIASAVSAKGILSA